MDNLRLDSHKLIFHPAAVTDWLNGKDIYPISIEVGLSNSCNHRCIFCAVDYSDYKPVFIDKDVILGALRQLSAKGTKSVVFSGEGEPLLNKNAGQIINAAKSFGMDVALSTNGVLFTESAAESCLPSLSWIRFSVSAATGATYSKIHQTKETDFDNVINNIKKAVEVKKKNKLNAVIGVQLLLLPENLDEAVPLAEKMKDIGVDYYTVKPYSKHPDSINNSSTDYENWANCNNIDNRLKNLQTDNYKVYFRKNQMEKLLYEKPYTTCYGLEFMTHIDSFGNVIPCIMCFGRDDFKYGNIYDTDIITIWEQRHKVINKINESNLAGCREVCRLDEMNIYLNELKKPGGHVNFI